MPTVDYEPVAVASGANVDSQANFSGSGYQQKGFQSGLSQSKQANKVWRQASMVGACIANFISQVLNINVLDDGNLANLIFQFRSAIRVAADNILNVAFSATPVFDASLSNSFYLILSGNVTSSTIVNQYPGQRITFVIQQDGSGGHTFVWPGNVLGATLDGSVFAANIQQFITLGDGTVRSCGPMIVT